MVHRNDIGEFIIGFDPIGPIGIDGDNSIGNFIIGVSPIGPRSTFDWFSTVLSQYANSPVLLRIMSNMAQYFDMGLVLDNFTDLVWDVTTAQGWGLDVWGRIVGVNRVLHVAAGVWLGTTGPPGVSGDSIGVEPFYSGDPTTSNFALSDDAYRTLILAKALANICDGSIPAINQILLNLFPNRGNCYVTEGDLTMTYTFEFVLTDVEFAIVEQSGVLPKPPGVSVTVVTP